MPYALDHETIYDFIYVGMKVGKISDILCVRLAVGPHACNSRVYDGSLFFGS